ncbi:hypothetical protein, partial [Salmonella sp. SAL4447]|uniref:hypothetical protein n=1 Tax=Salmonella sp. SAL4447 TaxID=3159902 RepID=UPI00397C76BC
WFFFGGTGPDPYLNPPYPSFTAGLNSLMTTYDARANSKYFVVEGTQHVLFNNYGYVLPDGGFSDPKPSRDGGTDLKKWVDGWA